MKAANGRLTSVVKVPTPGAEGGCGYKLFSFTRSATNRSATTGWSAFRHLLEGAEPPKGLFTPFDLPLNAVVGGQWSVESLFQATTGQMRIFARAPEIIFYDGTHGLTNQVRKLAL